MAEGLSVLDGLFMLVAVASLWRAVTLIEDEYLFPENKSGSILGSALIGLTILGFKGKDVWAAVKG